ncbi:MAG: FAD-dependent oxidoreductase [Hyphomicrobiaceae bacterium]|nr:MAG: FAD-dependent oxidoreductase [Hyphomicrobiaceae bacterium]
MIAKPFTAAREFEIAIVGGGLVGAALAWGLARLGRKVALLDEGDDATRAAAMVGLIAPMRPERGQIIVVGYYRLRPPVKPITLGEMASLPKPAAAVRAVERN